MASRAESIQGMASVSLKETLIKAGLAPELAALLDQMPQRTMQVDPRRPFREPGVQRNEVMALFGTAIVGLCGVGAVWLFHASAQALKKNWSIDARMRPDHELVRAGPYARLRHPIYLGLLLYMLALAVAAGHWLQLVAAVPLYLWGTAIRTKIEDRLLSETFGDSFDAYRRSTPALFPRIG